jgi:hypothetical protein
MFALLKPIFLMHNVSSSSFCLRAIHMRSACTSVFLRWPKFDGSRFWRLWQA